jgi:protein-L-isoaspartate(D-aspartate) O-methyltransferase
MDEAMIGKAYIDCAQPIGYGQTISQPSLVALMLTELETTSKHKCLEIGAGSGFVTALLARLVDEVWALEYLPELSAKAREKLKAARANNTHMITGDGSKGYPDKAPYDRILASAGAGQVPSALTDQLAEGGILIIPVRSELLKIVKTEGKLESKVLCSVSFVDFVNAG